MATPTEPTNTDDGLQSWLNRHATGENPPIDELYRYCEGRLRALVRPRLQKFPDARALSQTTDIANRTFMRLLAALNEVRPKTVFDLECFLAAIIRRVLLDLVKAVRRTPSMVSIEWDAAWPEEADTDVLDMDDMAAIHDAVRSLPPDQRTLCDLILYCGLSMSTAAARLGVTVSKVKYDWAKVKQTLRQQIGRGPAA